MSYCIREDYTPRLDNEPSDERGKTDTCQDEVYAAGKKLVDQHALTSVIDVGTGGGFKLLKYFCDLQTLGLDVEPNVSWLKTNYPEREWESVPLSGERPGFDLLICADVIEHLVEPDELLGFIERSKPKFAIISTPNRDNLQEWSWAGPPRNTCHVREWSSAEFAEYIGQRFEIIAHWYPDASRRDFSTQYVVVKCR